MPYTADIWKIYKEQVKKIFAFSIWENFSSLVICLKVSGPPPSSNVV